CRLCRMRPGRRCRWSWPAPSPRRHACSPWVWTTWAGWYVSRAACLRALPGSASSPPACPARPAAPAPGGRRRMVLDHHAADVGNGPVGLRVGPGVELVRLVEPFDGQFLAEHTD